MSAAEVSYNPIIPCRQEMLKTENGSSASEIHVKKEDSDEGTVKSSGAITRMRCAAMIVVQNQVPAGGQFLDLRRSTAIGMPCLPP